MRTSIWKIFTFAWKVTNFLGNYALLCEMKTKETIRYSPISVTTVSVSVLSLYRIYSNFYEAKFSRFDISYFSTVLPLFTISLIDFYVRTTFFVVFICIEYPNKILP